MTSHLCEYVYFIGADVSRCHLSDAGRILADTIREYMKDMDIPDGLTSLGYSFSDIPALVTGTLPQVYI